MSAPLHRVVAKLGDAKVPQLGPWTTVTVNYRQSCAIKNDRSLWCWGNNAQAQLGDGSWLHTRSPVQVEPGSTWLGVSTGRAYTCGIMTDGTLWCWGCASRGQLGEDTEEESYPNQVGSDTDWAIIAAGWEHSCALKTDQTLIIHH